MVTNLPAAAGSAGAANCGVWSKHPLGCCLSSSNGTTEWRAMLASNSSSVGGTVISSGTPRKSNSRLSRDRKRVVEGKSVSVRVGLGGRRIIKQKKHKYHSMTTKID